MNHVVLNILLAPFAVLIYGSGLLLWPVRRWLRRKQKERAKSLALVFLSQLVAYLAVACCCVFVHLGHFYYWFIILLELNIVFTIAGVIAWIRDTRHERTLEASHAA